MSNKKRKSISKKLSNSKNVSFRNSINESNTEECALTDLLNKKWKVFRVSPLYNFDATKLKRYGNKISQELNARRKFTSAVIYECNFLTKKLSLLNHYCDTIQVKVSSNQSQNHYNGYFISMEKEKSSTNSYHMLPILLVNARVHDLYQVHFSICKIFDCDIQPVKFSYYSLITFMIKLIETPRESDDKAQELLFLEYKIPDLRPSDGIRVSLFLKDTTIISAVLIDNLREQENMKNEEIIFEIYNRILNHIYNIYELDLRMADLYKITFPDAFITGDGQLKIPTEELAFTILNSLHEFTSLDSIMYALSSV